MTKKNDELTPEERFARIAEILGRGLVRLNKRAALKRQSENGKQSSVSEADREPKIRDSSHSTDDALPEKSELSNQ